MGFVLACAPAHLRQEVTKGTGGVAADGRAWPARATGVIAHRVVPGQPNPFPLGNGYEYELLLVPPHLCLN